MKCIFQKKPPSSLNYALCMPHDTSTSHFQGLEEFLIDTWPGLILGPRNARLTAVLLLCCCFCGVHCSLPLEQNSWLRVDSPNHKTNEERSTFGKSMVFEMAKTKMRAFLRRISHHSYAWLCHAKKIKLKPARVVDWIPSKSPWRHDVFSPKSRCSLESDFRLSRYSDIGLEFRRSQKKPPVFNDTTRWSNQSRRPTPMTDQGWGSNHPQLGAFIELDDGKIYRKALYLMVKTMVSCRFSLKPIHTCKVEAPNSIECVATSTINDVNRTRQPMHRTATHGRDLQLNSITDVLSQSYESKHV